MNRPATRKATTSLRTRLFLGLALLVVLLVVAQVWMVRSLTRELGAEVDSVAFQVGTKVASFFTFEAESSYASMSSGGAGEADTEIELEGDVESRGEGEVEPVDEHATLLDHAHRLEAIAGALEEDEQDERRTRVWVWSPSSEKLVEAPVHDMRIVVPPVNDAVDSGAAADQTSEEGTPEEEASPDADRAYTFQVSSAGDGHHVRTLDLPSGEETQIHLRGDVDARFLRLERPDLRAEVPIPRLGLRQKIERFQERLWLGSALLLVFGLLAAGYVSHRVSTPLAELAAAAEKVGGGELGVQVAAGGGGLEIQRAQRAFNAMSGRLLELDERNRRLEALRHLEELGDVARGLAHSLRNPLNALGLSVEQLAGASISDERKERLVHTAGRQVRRLDAGIRSFLVLASPGTGAGAETVQVRQLVRDVALEALQDAGGRVGVDVDIGDGALELPAVAAELRAIVQALVVNAVEASPDGGRVRVRLRAVESAAGEARRVRLEVEDRGPGLPPEVRARLGTPHVSTKPNGSGMGLFLVQRIAGFRYGGRLELIDREGGGTVARLEIGPRRLVAGSGDQSGESRDESRGAR